MQQGAEARRAAVERAIRDIRESLPLPPWATHTHTDLGLGVRPEADWQRARVAMNLRLLRVDQTLKTAGTADTAAAFQLLDGVEEELRDLRVNGLPELAKAIEAHDEAAKWQVELEKTREGLRRRLQRWERWGFILGPVGRRRRARLDGEIRLVDERLSVDR
jgi:hypothetical protein